MEVFESADVYIECGATIQDRISRIDAVIDALLTTAIKAAAKDGISEYSLNNGQTTIKTVLKGSDSVAASINAYRRLKKMFVEDLNTRNVGRCMHLIDSKNLSRGGGFR